ncbi:MAG: clan AA aspartic protease [Candidatus Accumulibacter regalis]|uniref:Clan AA aspartic protease n=1 Tax=Accumulibacter regalis TaxID=522306 RepID=A0A011R5J9_ACCRE|nr:TIGR02281 family clan AA aspartic protease [Accumulibacter sp.]EXI86409.1 MAG: clan AA aspartic protease [Candidatus Accumulibacter regalis]HRE70354.1 TIGR02281 family clan AA aspartic protease [Accumulibacter sp.]
MRCFRKVLGWRRGGPVFACCLAVGWSAVEAVDVGLAGVFPGKALLTIDGGAPRTVAVGAETSEGVRVVAVDRESATIESDGKKRTLRVGQNVVSSSSQQGGGRVVLTADGNGHFLTTGNINGSTVRFLVDTGATMISLGASDARRIGIDPSKGQPAVVNTANGQARVSRVQLDSVRVGEIVLHGIDALVHQQDMPVVLLGMTFLNRMEMQRDGQTMTLRKRY